MNAIWVVIVLAGFLFSCNNVVKKTSNPALPKPFETKSVLNFAQVIGWPAGQTPAVVNGFSVVKFAGGLDNPRRIYQAPNGDIFVSEATIDTTVLKNFSAHLIRNIKACILAAAPIALQCLEMRMAMDITNNDMFF